MKKILLSFMAMALLATSANAQVFNKEVKEFAKVELNNKFTAAAKVKAGPKRLKDNQELLGFPGSTGKYGLNIDGFKDWYEAKQVFSAIRNTEVSTKYKGYKVVGFHFAVIGSLGAKDVYAAAVFSNSTTEAGTEVNTALTKYDVSVLGSDNKVDVKWNEVMFDEPYTFTGNEVQIMYGFVFDSSAADEHPLLLGKEEKTEETKYGFLVYGRPSSTKQEGNYAMEYQEGFYVPCFQLIVESPNGETGILGVDGTLQPVPSKYYTLDGKQLSAPQKGLNLVKMSDGTTRKVVK